MRKSRTAVFFAISLSLSCGSSGGGGSDASPAADIDSSSATSDVTPVSAIDSLATTPISCEGIVPCGGNLVGRWNVGRTCFPAAFSGSTVLYQRECLQDIQPQGTGIVDFREDGAFSMNMNPYIEFHYSASCLASRGASCSAAADAFPKAYGSDARASYTEGGDLCKVTGPVMGAVTGSGTYRTFGPVFIESGKRTMFSEGGYCVRGDRLDFYQPSNTGVTITFTAFRSSPAPAAPVVGVDFETPTPVRTSLYSCSSDAPCGGDIVGTWNTANACEIPSTVEVSRLYPICSLGVDFDQKGSSTYNQDGTCALASSQSVKYKYSSACLALIGKKCEDLDGEVRALVASAGAAAGASVSVGCASTDQNTCVCAMDAAASTSSCQYSVQGTALTTVTTIGNTSPSTSTRGYCVTDYHLTVFSEQVSRPWSVATNQGVLFVKKR